jgi:hypothetical protein
LFWALPLFVVAVGIPVIQAVLHARRLPLSGISQRAVVALLNVLQPMARLRGRVLSGLTPWGRRRLKGFALPHRREFIVWTEHWRTSGEWLMSLEGPLQDAGAGVHRGGDYDRWDLEVRGGVLGGVRVRLLTEEHGQGRQLIRIRAWPRWPMASLVICVITALLAASAASDGARIATYLFGAVGLICFVAMVTESAAAMAVVRAALRDLQRQVASKSPAPETKPAAQTVVAPQPISR